MSDTRAEKRGREVWRLVEAQHGVVARRQLLALGFSAKAIEHRLRSGRLHLVLRGVYAVGRPQVDFRGRWMAAVLACGDGAMLSHRSAAALWEIGRERRGIVDISVHRRCELRRPGLRVRGRPTIAVDDIVERDGIPVTAVARTLVDLATVLDEVAIERAVNEADKRDLISPDALRAALDRYIGEPGVRVLRGVLDQRTFRLSDSDLEILFRPLAAEAGLPVPLSKQLVNGWTVDFYWPDLRLVVETDGLRYHRTASTQTRDVRRDRAHTLAGMLPLRFTHYEVKYEPTMVRGELRIAHALLRLASDIDPLRGG